MKLEEFYETIKELMEDDKHAAKFAELPVMVLEFNKPRWEIHNVRVAGDHVQLVPRMPVAPQRRRSVARSDGPGTIRYRIYDPVSQTATRWADWFTVSSAELIAAHRQPRAIRAKKITVAKTPRVDIASFFPIGPAPKVVD